MVCPSDFVIHTLRIRHAPTNTKLEWVVHHILLFTFCSLKNLCHKILQFINVLYAKRSSLGLKTSSGSHFVWVNRCSDYYALAI